MSRMAHSRTRTRWVSKGPALAALAGVVLGGCFPSYEQIAEETRTGLIGKSGSELRDCLGVPSEYDQQNGQEILTYRWTFKPTPRPHLGPDSDLTRREDPTRSKDPKDLGHCELVLLLGASGVTQVTVHGRDPE